ncbi:hypothetical protein DFH06DRAFT_749787 [Mycena polygramma]|nr:hypothetical protein DFH06DRAFT_749787 [Mycena polygramma]
MSACDLPLTEPALASPPAPQGAPLANLTRLLTSNIVPLDSEVPPIVDIISEGELQLHAVDSQIADLEATLAQLFRKREQILKHLRQHRAILSPVRRTPPELLCHIFTLTVSRRERPPWYLGQICQPWRLWALACSSLWNSIAIPDSRHSRLPRIKAQLLRSGRNAPLSVFWHEPTIDRHSADEVLSHCGRWSELHVGSQSPFPPDFSWLDPARGRLTTLRTFSFSVNPNRRITLPDSFSVAPTLREVFLTDWHLRIFSPTVTVPWEQITTYRGAYAMSTQREILVKATNLLQCAISFQSPSNLHENTPITLPHLRRLCVARTASLLNPLT